MLTPEENPSPEYWQRFASTLPTLGEAWIRACCKTADKVFLKDTQGTALNAWQALTASILLSRHIARLCPSQNVGIVLPSSAASVLCNMACMLLGKTAVNLNFTASTDTMDSAIRQAGIDTIFTSSRFLERLQQRGVDTAIFSVHSTVVVLEELAASGSTLTKVLTYLQCRVLSVSTLIKRFCLNQDPDQNAVILFSSGSEGLPKGVMLSHRSLLANVKQTALLFRFSDEDVILANLPPFHAFGLTTTYFLPLLEGITVVCHADPTDVFSNAMAISKYQATVLFGTSSFFRLYVRDNKVKPELLHSLKLVIAGAEKLQQDIREAFADKFGIVILEGYGATETAPVAAVNLPEQKRPVWLAGTTHKIGSVGLPLPGTQLLIVDPDSGTELATGEAGMVLICGPQLMHGYLNADDQTHQALRTIDSKRWYVSGDKGYLDSDGFLYIQDRYSRFAKISGEMIALANVEQAIANCIHDADIEVLVVNLPDPKKGEKLLCLSTSNLDQQALREQLLAGGLNALALPTVWLSVASIPKLGSGKTDFGGAKTLAARLTQ